MKNIKSVILFLLISFTSGCQIQGEKVAEIDLSNIKEIGELTTLECYYHNVASYFEADTSGFFIWKNDTKFWSEYDGIVRIGVDINEVIIDIDESKKEINITMPEATVLSCKIDENSFTKDSYYYDLDSDSASAITQKNVMAKSLDQLEEVARNDQVTINKATNNAKEILTEYVTNINKLNNTNYKIKFIEFKKN